MIINMTGGGGGSDLNFRVYTAESLPSTGKENDIVIITSTPMPGYIIYDIPQLPTWNAPGGVAGAVLLVGEITAMDTDTSFNALKKDTEFVCLSILACYQYTSVSVCRSKTAYQYLKGAWVKISSEKPITITVSYPSGSTCTCSDGTTTLKASGTSGSWSFTIPNLGTWTVTCSNGIESATATVSITAEGQTESVILSYNQIPTFTYSGSYSILDDFGNILTTTTGDWNIVLTSTGVLNISALNGAANGIDMFQVAGGAAGATAGEASPAEGLGGAGGAGGGCATQSNISLSANTDYAVTIGGSGGSTSAFGYSVSSGNGSSGGSGNGASTNYPGSAGSDGVYPFGSTTAGSGLYNVRYGAGGGGGGGTYRYGGTNWGKGLAGGVTGGGTGGTGGRNGATGTAGSAGAANTGAGGGGGGNPRGAGGAGGSGIVIIRNHRT